MVGFKEVFPNRHTVLPVIHVETPHQTLLNAGVAQKEGADGVFLISMQARPSKLKELYDATRREYLDMWIGLNKYPLPAVRMFQDIEYSVGGIWADNARIDERSEEQTEAERIQKARRESGWGGLYFGGVAFKGQREVDDLERASQIATKYMDVVTTSGTETGSPPDRERIVRMKGVIGDCPLAIASGISPENVQNYLDVADCFLVATSLLIPKREEFDPSRMRDLIQVVRG